MIELCSCVYTESCVIGILVRTERQSIETDNDDANFVFSICIPFKVVMSI